MRLIRVFMAAVLTMPLMMGACGDDSSEEAEMRAALEQEKAKLERQKAELWKMRYQQEKEKNTPD